MGTLLALLLGTGCVEIQDTILQVETRISVVDESGQPLEDYQDRFFEQYGFMPYAVTYSAQDYIMSATSDVCGNDFSAKFTRSGWNTGAFESLNGVSQITLNIEIADIDNEICSKEKEGRKLTVGAFVSEIERLAEEEIMSDFELHFASSDSSDVDVEILKPSDVSFECYAYDSTNGDFLNSNWKIRQYTTNYLACTAEIKVSL